MEEECIHWVIPGEGGGALDTVAMMIMTMIIMTIGGEQPDIQDSDIFGPNRRAGKGSTIGVATS